VRAHLARLTKTQTNDASVSAPLEREWNHRVGGEGRTSFVTRLATHRLAVDFVATDAESAQAALVDNLVDLRILAMCEVLVTGASSREGELAYYARGGDGVLNVESSGWGFKWK